MRHDANNTPGWEGSIGPSRSQYGQPHVYARDIQSGAGNCVCGHDLYAARHVQAAPGVPIPQAAGQTTPTDAVIAELERWRRQMTDGARNIQQNPRANQKHAVWLSVWADRLGVRIDELRHACFVRGCCPPTEEAGRG